jgi:threo-3-hydroxy-L-aspartate ammonia-lyase
MTVSFVTLEDIQAAQARIAGVAVRTPLLAATGLADDARLWLKPENLQPIGSFKIRGAFNRIAALAPEMRQYGVIAYSSGNHAQGVAYSARQLEMPATIVMPNNAPIIKINATRGFGAEVVLYDPATEKREEVAAKLLEGTPRTLVPPFNDAYVIAGQGTIGVEIFDDLPDVDVVFAPVGGGGLISGVAAALKTLKPSVKIYGVEPELADDARQSFYTGSIVEISVADASRTIADGTRTPALGALTFAHVRRYVDDILVVTETEIQSAVRELALRHKLVIEPSGALGYAGWVRYGAQLANGQKSVAVLSGGNIDPLLLKEWL